MEVDSSGFSVWETNEAIQNSLEADVQKKSGISDQRIQKLVAKALNSIGLEKQIPRQVDRTIFVVRYLYDTLDHDLILFQIAFVALSILLNRKSLSDRLVEYYPIFFVSTLVASIALLHLTEQLLMPRILNYQKKFEKNLNAYVLNQGRDPNVMVKALEIVLKLGYLFLDMSTKVLSFSFLMIGSVKMMVIMEARGDPSLIVLFFSGVSGIYHTFVNLLLNIKKGVNGTILCQIDPDILNIQGLEGFDCPIYLSEIKLPARLSECKHLFELKAIIEWLQIKDTCPLCIKEVNGKNQLVFVDREEFKVLDPSKS